MQRLLNKKQHGAAKGQSHISGVNGDLPKALGSGSEKDTRSRNVKGPCTLPSPVLGQQLAGLVKYAAGVVELALATLREGAPHQGHARLPRNVRQGREGGSVAAAKVLGVCGEAARMQGAVVIGSDACIELLPPPRSWPRRGGVWGVLERNFFTAFHPN